MSNKKYTLYFKGKNNVGNEVDVPIVSLSLKDLDIYTSNYEDYDDLFENLPVDIKEFIKKEFDITNLKDRFYITDYDFTPIMDVIFKKDSDVLYVEPKELRKLLENSIMSFEEFQKSKLKSINEDALNKKYNFYKYLYDTYVKNNRIKCMIDLYYVSKKDNQKDEDSKYIEAIATDKINLMVLAKKLSQTEESRRNLTYEFKRCICDNIINEELINYRKKIQSNDKALSSMIVNFSKFVKEYKRA